MTFCQNGSCTPQYNNAIACVSDDQCLSQHCADGYCCNAACAVTYPILDGIPVLLDERHSMFSVADFVDRRETTFREPRGLVASRLASLLDRLPKLP